MITILILKLVSNENIIYNINRKNIFWYYKNFGKLDCIAGSEHFPDLVVVLIACYKMTKINLNNIYSRERERFFMDFHWNLVTGEGGAYI